MGVDNRFVFLTTVTPSNELCNQAIGAEFTSETYVTWYYEKILPSPGFEPQPSML
jgi:hypothetical protein